MQIDIREATIDDLDAIAALTRAHRHRLAAWSPTWWCVADGADEIHPLWLGHLITSDAATVRVLVDGAEVVGCLAEVAQPAGWFVDDVAIDDDGRWPQVSALLRSAVTVRPALTCVATDDRSRRDALAGAGIERVSSYWIRPTSPLPAGADVGAATPLEPGSAVADAPPHTFGDAFDPGASGALAAVVGDGHVVGSPPVPPPPVYGAGGTVAVVDRLVGSDRRRAAATALALAADRGDLLLAVVAGADDDELADVLAGLGFVRTVDVHQWPADGDGEGDGDGDGH